MRKLISFLILVYATFVIFPFSVFSQEKDLVLHFVVQTNFLKSNYDLFITKELSLWKEISNPTEIEIKSNYVPSDNYKRSCLFKDFQNNEMLTDYSILGVDFYMKDSIRIQKWTLLNETEEYLGYECKKAITEFRGRKYNVLYTTKIPINNGPWKFGGLPGMILKISNEHEGELYKMECIGIDFHDINLKEQYDFYLKKNKKKEFKCWSDFKSDFDFFLKKYIKSLQSDMESEDDSGFSIQLTVENYLEIFSKEIQTDGIILDF